MPLTINVGLNRKVGEPNYGSRGASVHLELELDSSLVNEPPRLQEKIRQLFGMVRASLAEELKGGSGGQASNGNGQEQVNGKDGKPRPATQSQVRALNAVAKNQGLDIAAFIHERFQVHKAEELSVKQASEAIAQLKSSNPSHP